MYKIRTYNAISVKGLDRFPRAQFEVGSDVAHPDAFLLRSQKLHDESVPDTLLAAARAVPQAEVTNNNEADALIVGAVVCQRLGLPILPVTQYRRDVIEALED